MSKKTFTLIIVIVLAAIGAAYYWFFVRNASPSIDTSSGTSQGGSSIFGNNGSLGNQGGKPASSTKPVSTEDQPGMPVPVLRELSKTPVGGMAASTTASSTIIRWIDRGVGRVYQAYSDNTVIDELSNTTIPRVYSTYWNHNTTSFILQSVAEDSDKVTSFYATLFPVTQLSATSSGAASTPFELRGSSLPSATLAVAISPKGDRVFTLENNALNNPQKTNVIDMTSTGYISQFNGTKKSQVLSTPLSRLNIEWPEENTLAITTKGSAGSAGFLYFVNPKDGLFNKILGNIGGLSTLTSKDASRVLYTASTDTGIKSSLYNVKTGSSQDMIFNTMPEKCVWSTLQKNILYCAVPSTIPSATYPDDWYKGSVSFSDSIWEVDTTTGDAHQIVNLLKVAGTTIDATNLVLDPQENYLYFINNKNLTLWSLELNG